MNIILLWMYMALYAITKLLSSNSIISRTVLFEVNEGLIVPISVRVELLRIGKWFGMYRYTIPQQDSVTYEFGMPELADLVNTIAKKEGMYKLDRLLSLLWSLDFKETITLKDDRLLADTKVTVYRPSQKQIDTTPVYPILSKLNIGKPGDILYDMPVVYMTNIDGAIYGIPEVIVTLNELISRGQGTDDHKTYLSQFYQLVYRNSTDVLDKIEFKLKRK